MKAFFPLLDEGSLCLYSAGGGRRVGRGAFGINLAMIIGKKGKKEKGRGS